MQSAILTGVPRVARYMSFSLRADAAQATSIEPVQAISIDDSIVVGIGEPLIAHWRSSISGLRTFPAISGPGVQVPSTQLALWCWLRGDDQGELVKRSISISDSLSSHYVLEQTVDGFKFGDANLGKDLTGYEDGTDFRCVLPIRTGPHHRPSYIRQFRNRRRTCLSACETHRTGEFLTARVRITPIDAFHRGKKGWSGVCGFW
jgi:hypothetical protein